LTACYSSKKHDHGNSSDLAPPRHRSEAQVRIRAAQNGAYRLEEEERKRKIQEADDADEARKEKLERLRTRGQQGM
jgi:hypothetical protein